MLPRFSLFLTLMACTVACRSTNAIVGEPCTTDSQCGSGYTCTNKQCATSNVGGPGQDGGGGGDGGGGTQDGGGGSDGGCVNLQCKQTACPNSGTTSLSGTVYDPAGNVPLFNALVYVPNGPVQPFTQGVSCDVCGSVTTSGSPLVLAQTGADGTFKLTNVPDGTNIPLVIQIGRWRRQVTIPQVTACTNNVITDVNLTRLPRNQSEGDIPLMAIATGLADPMECLLRKIGISDSEFTPPTGNGRIHYYVENGTNMNPSAPQAGVLLDSLTNLKKYDIVLLPCEGSENQHPTETQNIVDYTSAGGRVFTTHYGYVWIADAPDPFPSTANWTPDPNQLSNPPDPWNVSLVTTFDKGKAFVKWLENVGASTPGSGIMTIHQGRHNVSSVNVDAGTSAWMESSHTFSDGGVWSDTPYLTFNTPVGAGTLPDGGEAACGRVVFSDFHVTTDAKTDAGFFPASCANAPITSQEKALEFMLFDLSSCIQSDTAPTCRTISQSCSPTVPCCPGLSCQDSNNMNCDGTKPCTCQYSAN